ncbi:hypothetical protein [Paraurantiacibacter namhicola]|uniref:Uncharacterized protein n=1 Tax=Paraurantiacibacter namhicola TaxID=645517 RepID=A0A1C7D621_9SPHN|nr:hypothetical protein [Paraurantiacibacter namhicola]ANU06936.1 hypothetical protein A6F65_00614 [Paraurantiacibacter namhicola]
MSRPNLLRCAAALAAIALLPACGSDADPGPGGVNVSEAKALDDAAAMLEERRPELPEASETSGAEPGTAPAATE